MDGLPVRNTLLLPSEMIFSKPPGIYNIRLFYIINYIFILFNNHVINQKINHMFVSGLLYNNYLRNYYLP